MPKSTSSHYGDKWLVALLVSQNINGYCLVDSSFNWCGMLIKDITYSFILYFSFYFLLFSFSYFSFLCRLALALDFDSLLDLKQ